MRVYPPFLSLYLGAISSNNLFVRLMVLPSSSCNLVDPVHYLASCGQSGRGVNCLKNSFCLSFNNLILITVLDVTVLSTFWPLLSNTGALIVTFSEALKLSHSLTASVISFSTYILVTSFALVSVVSIRPYWIREVTRFFKIALRWSVGFLIFYVQAFSFLPIRVY